MTLIFRILTGLLVDHRPPKRALTQAHLIYLLSFVMLHSDNFWIVSVGRVVLGCALGFIATLLLYYSVSSESSVKGKSQSVSLLTFFGILPTCIAPFTALQLKDAMGIDAVTDLAIFFVLVSLVLSVLTDRKLKIDYGKSNGFVLKELFGILINHSVRTVISLLILTYIISGTTVTFLPQFFEQRGYSYASWYFFIFSVFMVLPRFLLKNAMPDGSEFPNRLLLICVLMGLAGNCLNLYGQSFVMLGLAAMLNGSTLGIIYPAIMSYTVCSVSDRLTGSVSATVSSAADIGVILSNLLLGIVSNQLGLSYALLLPIIASVLSVGLLTMNLISQNAVSRQVP
jgi:MFS family permease